MNIFERVGRWLTPYKYAFDKEEYHQVEKSSRRAKLSSNKKQEKDMPVMKQEELSDFLERGEIGVSIVNIKEIMDEKSALERLLHSSSHNGYFIHTEEHHQLAIRFRKGSAWNYYERSNKRRVKLKPLIEYKEKGLSDKTHLIPVGFHGSENDERLLIDFDSTLNRKHLKKFEDYIAKINEKSDVLWFINIVRQQDDTMIWNASVWNEHGDVIKRESFHDKNKVRWR